MAEKETKTIKVEPSEQASVTSLWTSLGWELGTQSVPVTIGDTEPQHLDRTVSAKKY
jgi:hypothetical protein